MNATKLPITHQIKTTPQIPNKNGINGIKAIRIAMPTEMVAIQINKSFIAIAPRDWASNVQLNFDKNAHLRVEFL